MSDIPLPTILRHFSPAKRRALIGWAAGVTNWDPRSVHLAYSRCLTTLADHNDRIRFILLREFGMRRNLDSTKFIDAINARLQQHG